MQLSNQYMGVASMHLGVCLWGQSPELSHWDFHAHPFLRFT